MLARDIEMFIEHCELKELSQKTINNYLRNMNVFFDWCVEEDLILRSPVKACDFINVASQRFLVREHTKSIVSYAKRSLTY